MEGTGPLIKSNNNKEGTRPLRGLPSIYNNLRSGALQPRSLPPLRQFPCTLLKRYNVIDDEVGHHYNFVNAFAFGFHFLGDFQRPLFL